MSEDLEGRLPADHEAREVWAFVEQMDLSRFYEGIRAVEGVAGRTPTDPQVLVGLWLYAAIDGVGSAREIDRLTESDDAYRWLRGGVPLNHRMLSEFRVQHQAALDGLFTQSIAALLSEGIVTLKRVAQDGTRIRANAGSSSFRRLPAIERSLAEAEAQLEWVRRDADKPDGKKTARALAAQERHAQKRIARLNRAVRALHKIAEKQQKKEKKTKKKKEPRASTTDPDARVMQMSDGGYRPAYNFQFATDVASKAVVGVDVSDSPSDSHQMPPMLEQIEARLGKKPDEYLVDKGYVDFDSIEKADAAGVVVYGPVTAAGRTRADGTRRSPLEPKASDSEAVVHWRLRMASEEGQTAYRKRCETAELTNAEVKTRQGLTQVMVRGMDKVKCVALWAALAVNMTRIISAGLV